MLTAQFFIAHMQKHHGVIIFLLLYLCVPLICAASSLDGDWVGGFDRPKGQVYVHAHFGTATNGTIDVIDPLFKSKLPQFDLQVGYVANMGGRFKGGGQS